MQGRHDAYAAFRVPSYRHFLAGGILSIMGAEIQFMAVGWELWNRTFSPAALGMVGLVLFAPVLLFFLPAGHVADRVNRRMQLQVAQSLVMLSSLGLLLLTATDPQPLVARSPLELRTEQKGPPLADVLTGRVLLIYLCLVFSGIGRAFSAPARGSLMAQIVPREAIGNAVTWNSSSWQFANVAGPALGGLVMALTGRVWAAFLVAALCSLSSIVLLFWVRPARDYRATGAFSLEALLAGMRFVWKTKLLLATITLDLFAVLLGGATALLPIYARDILEVGEVGYGWLRAAPAVGALFMAISLAHRPPLRWAGPSLLASVAGFGVCTIVFGLSANYWLSLAMLALLGALDNISVVIRQTLVQVLTPDAMRGRVGAINLMFISSSNELGSFESGMTADWWGTVPSVVVGGIGAIVVVVGAMAWWPQLVTMRSLPTVETDESRNHV